MSVKATEASASFARTVILLAENSTTATVTRPSSRSDL